MNVIKLEAGLAEKLLGLREAMIAASESAETERRRHRRLQAELEAVIADVVNAAGFDIHGRISDDCQFIIGDRIPAPKVVG